MILLNFTKILFYFHVFSPFLLSAKQRDLNFQSYDDILPYYGRSISMGKTSTTKKLNESENSLPVPMHIRANSTPAHMETQRNELAQHHHKRYPSCVETSPRKDATKKSSMDNFTTRNTTDDRHSKRASSESKDKMTKRNASSPAAISLLSVTTATNEKQKTDLIKASPELLAELLKGSSEKMTAAERERSKKAFYFDSTALPIAVQKYLVCNKACNYTF